MLKNRDVPKELKIFNSLFYEFHYKFDLSQIFDDLLTMIICAMGHQTQEDLYLQTIKKYNRQEIDIFCKLFGELMKIYNQNKTFGIWCDPLGDYYECLASNYKKSSFGQFFTPRPICDFMAKILFDSNDWGKTMNEPTCGSGRMILAANQHCKGNYYVCEDLDPICCKMTAINLCFHEIRAEIHCHDALMMNNYRFSLVTNYEFWKHETKCIFYYPSAKNG
ncbi:N-6 DNA methylase [Flavobacterium sp.]|uniref:N-6 DNA methylase n=1 Tax=Flavobacterium sp. TaxID=239 RepID=UPI00262D1B92|nr:N-6 DNA methylase [Flavobacterium sp.]